MDTPLISRAVDYARAESEPFLFNHAVRSRLFAVRLGQLQGIPHDAEVVAVGSLLHDLGLTDCCTGPKRFVIWDSVALNSTPSIGLYKEPEVALCTAGIGLEFGFQYERIPPSEMKSILAAFPRLDMKRRFADSVCRIVKTKQLPRRPLLSYRKRPKRGRTRLVRCYVTSTRLPAAGAPAP
jgi:hypothetical protein